MDQGWQRRAPRGRVEFLKFFNAQALCAAAPGLEAEARRLTDAPPAGTFLAGLNFLNLFAARAGAQPTSSRVKPMRRVTW
jgi:hypothetical protein